MAAYLVRRSRTVERSNLSLNFLLAKSILISTTRHEAHTRAPCASTITPQCSQRAPARPQRLACPNKSSSGATYTSSTGYKIPAIENLGVTRVRFISLVSLHFISNPYYSKDQHDAIDFTDNSILILGNLPLLKRLTTLLLANNRIQSISPSIHLSVPNLTTLVLTNNNIGELGDLEPLKEVKHLKYISLLGNPVRERKWYREWLAWRIPGLRVIDFQRIRDKVCIITLQLKHFPIVVEI